VRIGTRGSALALAQSQAIAKRIQGAELVRIDTSGDRGQAGGDKARWVDAIERALLDGEIDLAVHSAKDVPAVLADGLELVACPERADPRDALCLAGGDTAAGDGPHDGAAAPGPLVRLRSDARVGTSSLRRAAQLKALREDLRVVELRGNVDTRLLRLAEGGFDAIVLARAGLQRLGRDAGVPLDELIPAAGQGTLALEARAGDERAARAAAALRHADTEATLAAERALVATLGADCHSAVGARARVQGSQIELEAWIGLHDGSAWIADRLSGENPQALGREMARRMLTMGAREMLLS
jgi:hydroxymethylbilane synthase